MLYCNSESFLQVLNSTDEEVTSVDGVAPNEGTGCALSGNRNHCIVSIQGLDPETEYTIKFIPRDDSSTEELTGKTSTTFSTFNGGFQLFVVFKGADDNIFKLLICNINFYPIFRTSRKTHPPFFWNHPPAAKKLGIRFNRFLVRSTRSTGYLFNNDFQNSLRTSFEQKISLGSIYRNKGCLRKFRRFFLVLQKSDYIILLSE